jgi:hypothetical protein
VVKKLLKEKSFELALTVCTFNELGHIVGCSEWLVCPASLKSPAGFLVVLVYPADALMHDVSVFLQNILGTSWC